jgi:hypothetical protein
MEMPERKKYWRLELDYDEVPPDEVEKDAKKLAAMFPELGDTFRVERSKSMGEHFHLIFQKSQFTSFQEAYNIAMKSGADRDWLALCEEYKCFGLETEGSRRYNEVRQQREKRRVINKPIKMLTSPYILDLIPTTALDARRIVKVCEAIDDPTWKHTSFVNIWELKTHVQIGCINEAQATRRMKWLSEQALSFTATVKQNTRALDEKKESI